MTKINEGNLYNVEDEFSKKAQPSTDGLAAWKKEMRKQLGEYLKRQKIPYASEAIRRTFGDMLD